MLQDVIRPGLRARLGNAVLAARLFQRQSPSSALYFVDALANLIGSRFEYRDRPIRRITGSLFVCGDAAVVIRYIGQRELAILERRKFGQVYLLVDDDFFALNDNDGLPPDYRQKLLAYRDGIMRRLMQFVTHVVAPSQRILAGYGHKHTLHLDPAQCHATGSLAHHQGRRGLEVVFAATRSHLFDLHFFADAIAEFLLARPDARLTTFLNGHAPKVLKGLHNAIHLPTMGWNRYQAFVAENHFHVAIAPALATDFNRARSLSRLHDHAAYGAAGIYSRQAPFSGIIADGNSGLLLGNEPARWRDALFGLAKQPDRAEKLAAEGQALSRRLGDRHRVRSFWMQELGMGRPDRPDAVQ